MSVGRDVRGASEVRLNPGVNTPGGVFTLVF
jgi:hypothetical protein